MVEPQIILRRVLAELHKDGVIDCNQYQGEDFVKLLERIGGNKNG